MGILAPQPCTTTAPQGLAAGTDTLSGLRLLVSEVCGTWLQPSAPDGCCLVPEHHPLPQKVFVLR